MTDAKKVIQILNAGGVAILPTETLYGLVCDATNPQALLKIYQIKNRPIGKAFPVLVKDLEMLSRYASFNPEQKKAILKAKRPTNFVLKARNLSPLLTQKKTAVFRIAKHPVLKKIFVRFDRPVVATSANLAGKEPINDPRKYQEVFGKNSALIDLAVFYGINRRRNPSAIVDLTKKPFRVLR